MKKNSSRTLAAVVGGLLLALVGCNDHTHAPAGHAHGSESDRGHGHGVEHAHGGGHGVSHRPTHVRTLVGEHTELFVEFPAFVGGVGSSFAAHFTSLEDYQPVREGKCSVVLTSDDLPGGRWDADAPARPGIFTPTATPKYTGKRRLLVTLETAEFTDRFDLGELVVFDSEEEAREAEVSNPEGDITFLKEQQWKVDFQVTEVTRQRLRPSVEVNATLRAAADGDAVVTAPFDGRITAPKDGIPQVGDAVAAGEVVAYVVPKLDAGEISQLQAQQRKAEVALARAKRDRQRVSGLVSSGALPERRLRDAESEVELAQAEVSQARRRLGQYRNLESRRGGGRGVAIRSAIDGTIAHRSLVEGGFVSSGEQLLRVVDRSQLWLEAHVPEANLGRLRQPTGVWFEPEPGEPPIAIDVGEGGRLVSFGEVIDPRTRTAPLTFELGPQEGAGNLRVGAFVNAHVFSGQPRDVVAIPASSILDEKGLDVVFVMVSGESFERRTVRLGIRDRQMVEVLDGVEPGERVVSEGVYYVKLASTSTGSVGHGHAH